MTLKLEVGKKYRNRIGEVVEIVSKVDSKNFPFRSASESYTEEGYYMVSVGFGNDLIEEVIEEPLKKPLTLAEDLAKAAGILLAYGHGVLSNSLLTQANVIYESIKPPEVPQWRKDLAQAIEDGKVVECCDNGTWRKTKATADDFLNPNLIAFYGADCYRIKPEPKPDVMGFLVKVDNYAWIEMSIAPPKAEFVAVIRDGTTGALKSSEVLK